MRREMLAISLLAIMGCQAQHAAQSRSRAIDEPDFDQAQAAALVFDPPISGDAYLPELSRAGRDLSAFVGYEDVTTTYTYLRIDDRASTDRSDRYERRAISERLGVSYH